MTATAPGDGGIERWLTLDRRRSASTRAYVRLDARHAARQPASRSRPMSISCATGRCSEAIASSLTELFSPDIIAERVAGMLESYDFISARHAGLFRQRA